MTNNNEKKRLWHNCFLLNLAGSLMLLKMFHDDGTIKVSHGWY